MAKFSVTILGIVTLQLISGTLARPENYRLSEEQITKLRDIASKWAEVINFEKKPCDVFYNFVCSSQEYPNLERKYSANILENILKENIETITETEGKFLKYSTATCGEFEENEKDEFIKWFRLENSIGSWPAFVENWDDSKFNLPLGIAELNSYSFPVVFAQELTFHYSNNFEPTLEIYKQDVLDIETEKDLFKSKFEKLGVKNSEDVINDAVLFEKTFKEATESVKSATNKRITFSELRDFLPEVDWDKQIEIIYDGKLPDNFAVLMKNHEELNKIYKAISKLSPKIISNYFFCSLVYALNGQIYSPTSTLFMPVIKQAFLKHWYDQNTKEILKGMYVTVLETVQDWKIPQKFKTHYSAEQIAKIFDEEIVELANEEDLANEFKEVSSNSHECVKNYYRLQKLIKKRLARPAFNYKNNLINIIESGIISDLFYDISAHIEDPSPSLFIHITMSVMANVFEISDGQTIYPNETINCFSNEFVEEVTPVDMRIISGAQFVLKTFAEWTKNYPNIVQEENKILQEYDLTAEKLLVIFLEKPACERKEIFKTIMTALANSPAFQQIFDCPLGSKLNTPTKCNLW